MTKDQFDATLPLAVPADIAVCPICGAGVLVDEIQDWGEEKDQLVIHDETDVSVDCEKAPDIDDTDDFDEFMAEHWSMPYVDWLPVQTTVRKWLQNRKDTP